MNSITMNWEKAKLDAKFGMFRARQRIKKGISG